MRSKLQQWSLGNGNICGIDITREIIAMAIRSGPKSFKNFCSLRRVCVLWRDLSNSLTAPIFSYTNQTEKWRHHDNQRLSPWQWDAKNSRENMCSKFITLMSENCEEGILFLYKRLSNIMPQRDWISMFTGEFYYIFTQFNHQLSFHIKWKVHAKLSEISVKSNGNLRWTQWLLRTAARWYFDETQGNRFALQTLQRK